MWRTLFTAALAGWLPCALAGRNTTASREIVTGTYLVELSDDSNSGSFYQGLSEEVGEVSQRLTIDSALFRGVSFSLKNISDDGARVIERMSQVKSIWPVSLIPAPDPEIRWTGQGADFSKISNLDAESVYAPHRMTQVDKLHEKGYKGNGTRIAIVDTGVDYNHPALGGCFGPGCLVSFGTDLVGDDYNGSNMPVPDDDPFDTCIGHGTHVAGIIAAQANPLGFIGAAPEVELGMYRVFGCADGVGTDVLIAAFIQAYKDGADIITASIGGLNGFEEEPWSVVASRIALEGGVPVTIAAGNKGQEGLFYASSAAGGNGVMGIASFDNDDYVSYENGQLVTTPDPNGGFPSYFSSWGPLFELQVKPQFGAPGGGILSTYPTAMGSYAVLSGTSMATPLAASIVALIGQVKGKIDRQLIENALATTAVPNLLSYNGVYPYLAPIPQQGAGLVKAYDAAFAKTLVDTPNISFNDTEFFKSEVNIGITNTGSEPVSYKLGNSASVTAFTLYENSVWPESLLMEITDKPASLRFEPETLTLDPGSSTTVKIFATPPEGLLAQRIPVYSGFVTLNATNGENLSIPYQGVAGKMRDTIVLEQERSYLTETGDPLMNEVANGTIFVLSAPEGMEAKNSSFYENKCQVRPFGVLPQMFYLLPMGSPEIRIEVVPLACNGCNATEHLGTATIGNIAGFPQVYVPPWGYLAPWDGLLNDGTYAPAGTYRLLVRALKIFGDRTKASHYLDVETPAFRIVYARDG
ncbi:unnamed protein product [Clonostachys rhizophaga]|uniref:Uncharacterized protein n=1 Tax=Clonostachys rhizophaga TaxID=160324 RepID=A0A9N9YLE5_9HYPO|nr:unnamed protein product [Clonostachys rhizophaga]